MNAPLTGSASGFHGALAAAAGTAALLSAHAAVAVDLGAVQSYVVITLALAVVYLVGVWVVLNRSPRRHDLALILVAAIAMRGLALTPAPNLSTDAYRYVWDGRVQAAGINPYLYVPADQRLEYLRDQEIYPNINQKERAVTIYPPAAQLVFRATQVAGGGLAGVRTVMVIFDLLTVCGLLALLRVIGQPLERVLIYAWHPIPIWEFAAQSHIDAAATAAIVLGVLAAARGRQALAGAIFAIAVLVKYFPAVLLPAVWRSWDWRLPTAFAATAVLLYLLYVREAGTSVLGFLGGHLDNEGYGAGWGFHPVWMLRDFNIADPSAASYVAAALMLLGILAAYTLFARHANADADGLRFDHLLLLGGAFVFLTSPHYPWYFGFLTALLVLAPQAWAFAMTLLAVVLYLPRPPGELTWTELYLVVYWLPFALWAITAVLSAWRGRSARQPDVIRRNASER